MYLQRSNSSTQGENTNNQNYCEVEANTKNYQHDSSRPQSKNVRIIEITNSKQSYHQNMAKPQWCSKVFINCERPCNNVIESAKTKERVVKGINKIYIGEEGKTSSNGRQYEGNEKNSSKDNSIAQINRRPEINCFSPERISAQGFQNVLVKRSKSEVTPERDKVEVIELKKHCKSLVDELDSVKSEIVKILTEKNKYMKQNDELHEYKATYEELELENKQLKKQLLKIKEEQISDKEIKEVPEFLDVRSSPDGKPTISVTDEEGMDEKRRENRERHRFLEETLSLMKREFEEKENDWKRKLENERQLHEEKNKENEKMLKKLEMQLKNADKQLAAVASQEKAGNDGSNCSIGSKPRKFKEKSIRKKVVCHNKNLLKKAPRCTCYETPHEPPSSCLRGTNSDGIFQSKESSQQDLVLSVVKEIMKLQHLRSSIIEECQYLVSKTNK